MNDELDREIEREMERVIHTESFRPGNGVTPEIDIRGYTDPVEGEMTVLTLTFNVTALDIHLNRDWLHVLCANIDYIERERRVAKGMEIVRRIMAETAPSDEP